MAEPLLSLSSSQMLEALRTGGVDAFIPWISRAVDAVRQAGSKGIEGLRQQLARSGFGGTLGAQGAIAGAEQETGQQVASTPTDMIMSWIQKAPDFARGVAGLGAGQLGTAAQFNQTTMGKTTSTPSFWDLFFGGLGAGGQAGMGAAGIGSLFGGGGAAASSDPFAAFAVGA